MSIERINRLARIPRFYERYEIISELGGGDNGVVYLIKEILTGDQFALKVVSPFSTRDESEARVLIEREAKAALEVSHPNTVRVIESSATINGQEICPYFIMEYFPEGDLAKLISRQKKEINNFIAIEQILNWMIQLSDGLAAINEKIIHRDIKPANVFIKDTILRIGDFGMAKYVEEKTRLLTFKGLGTYAYMAPESWNIGKVSPATDIYSLGVLFFELAALQLPYDDYDISSLKEKHLYASVPSVRSINPSIPMLIDGIVQKMMAKNPSSRFQNASEVSAAIKAIAHKSDDSRLSLPSSLPPFIKIIEEDTHRRLIERLEFDKKLDEKLTKIIKINKIREVQQGELFRIIQRSINFINDGLKQIGLEGLAFYGKPLNYHGLSEAKRELLLPGTEITFCYADCAASLTITTWPIRRTEYAERAFEQNLIAFGIWRLLDRNPQKRRSFPIMLEADFINDTGKWVFTPNFETELLKLDHDKEAELIIHFLLALEDKKLGLQWHNLDESVMNEWFTMLASRQ